MRKVMIVVPVLITSCQVSLKWKAGPVIAHTMIVPIASMKVMGRAEAWAAQRASRSNQEMELSTFPPRRGVPGARGADEVEVMQRPHEVLPAANRGRGIALVLQWVAGEQFELRPRRHDIGDAV